MERKKNKIIFPYWIKWVKKNSGYTRPTLFVGWGEGLDLCELENAPETQKCRKTFVHDCRLILYFLCLLALIIHDLWLEDKGNRPFYRYGGHIELIRFKEYYRMPRGHEHI